MENNVSKNKKTRSVENLHHFRCVECDKWWTVPDAPEVKTDWFCAWCGTKNEYKIATSHE